MWMLDLLRNKSRFTAKALSFLVITCCPVPPLVLIVLSLTVPSQPIEAMTVPTLNDRARG